MEIIKKYQKDIDISKYITRLEAKQEEMLSVLHKRTSFINLSEPPAREYKSDDDSNIQSNKRNRSSKNSKSSTHGKPHISTCLFHTFLYIRIQFEIHIDNL